MDTKVKGSWLIHNTNKLASAVNQGVYENTYVAGKAGIFLSAISATDEQAIDNQRLRALANANNINASFELKCILDILSEHELIDRSESGIAVLGVTTTSALQHTAKIFQSLEPNALEESVLELAEISSNKPVDSREVSEYLSDTFKLSASQMGQVVYDSESYGFVDVEPLGKDSKLYFNGNLFRRGSAEKTKKVLDSLKPAEASLLMELNAMLQAHGCIDVSSAKRMLGDALFSKVSSIALYDINVVSNCNEEAGFLTLPSAFSKYSNSQVEDAFDLAKAFVASLTYGMTKSYHERGQIKMIEALLNKLLRGEAVGPVNAIGQDYKILELKGVVSIFDGRKNGRVGPMMRLLKREVGELALRVLQTGDVSEESLLLLPGAAVTKFTGPEVNREIVRRKQVKKSPFETNDMISALRTGNIR
ncbi:hypothetical protein L5179_002695 [Vibrio parahaemolyticus]|nr:hypothetical protein [Vibrio parahaemolyticus]EIU6759879.1 hypothetical protein [Vibrio parahaemolyticus]EJG1292448.1 hypothetical protein [Vibrio parahaemolyticus]EKB3552850.1 hypothetical protein [Vibrio parahaemolyticus]ELH3113989.1 hypothetical protein [Vibrio parahaemolyticus]